LSDRSENSVFSTFGNLDLEHSSTKTSGHVYYIIPFGSVCLVSNNNQTANDGQRKKKSHGHHLVILKFLQTFPSREAAYFLHILLPILFEHHEPASPHVSATLNICKSPIILLQMMDVKQHSAGVCLNDVRFCTKFRENSFSLFNPK